MSTILDRLPYAEIRGSVSVCGEEIAVLPHQIIVWVTLTSKDQLSALTFPRFPAIVDTGNTFGFSIAEEQLMRWCDDLSRSQLEVLGPVRINGQLLMRHAADVWLHRNQRHKRDSFRKDGPFRLELRDGIAVYPAGLSMPRPRLPLLGLRAIDENGLRATINGKKRTLSLTDA